MRLDSLCNLIELKPGKDRILQMDIEGAEYNALLGADGVLSTGLVDYIQMEYNQTWIAGGGTIEKILKLCQKYGYDLYRIKKRSLNSIENYNFNVDDFFYCNILMVKSGKPLPLPCTRRASPLV